MTRRWLAVATVLLAVGCPQKPDQLDGGATDAGVEDFEVELRALVARYGSVAEANDANELLRSLRAGLRSGRLSLDRSVLARCLASNDLTPAVFYPPSLRGSCLGLYRPLVAVGGACGLDGECVNGVCRSLDGGCGRVCVALAAEGAPCLNAPCRPGSWCNQAQVCQALGREGAACPCAEDLHCDGANTCRAFFAEGAACSTDACVRGRCISGRCGWLSVGETCPHSSFCVEGAACLVDAGVREVLATFSSAPGVCKPAARGVPCDSQAPRCADGLVCSQMRWLSSCVDRVAAGEACTWDDECGLGFRCTGGRCRRKVAPGEDCSDPQVACMPGAVCVAGRCSRRPRPPEPCTATCFAGTCVNGRCVGDAGLGGCSLGGEAKDDFFGPNEEVPDERPCVPTGPPQVVRPLSRAEASCAFGGRVDCVGCHTAAGCPELRPQYIPPPFNHAFSAIARECLDGG